MSTDRSRNLINRQIIDEAAAWFVEINEGEPDRDTRQRFDEWLRRSPEHARAYLRILPVWEEGAQLNTQANSDPKALIAWAREGTNVVPLAVARPDTEPPWPIALDARPAPSRRGIVALAASLLCGVIGLAAWWLVDHRNVYEAGIGDQRMVALSDGSRVKLNSRSKLRVTFNRDERGIELLAGQALFRVAKDPGRPFIVRSGDVVVRAIGTQFDVYRKPSGTVVTVVEGRVAVSPLTTRTIIPEQSESSLAGPRAVVLDAGEQTVVAPKAFPKPAMLANVAAATAWTQQRLEFSMTPLPEVAEEFNRYNTRQIIVRDEKLRHFNVTGTFSSSEPDSLLRFLQAQEGVKVEESSEEIVISQK